ncbi:hypothetical protein ADIARSV_0074 [Arcticibacter svalbardensis MN12-7]|uniref:Uncharacterized protein n=1 Tax=Arcticibacter svalbardensis MN12-7 TaxID=1150600 RepID=R9GY52_9SPHI|nr:hypothetical protein ADIARSV_0074 [Arcticibacter svalbardensis MN12-7]
MIANKGKINRNNRTNERVIAGNKKDLFIFCRFMRDTLSNI